MTTATLLVVKPYDPTATRTRALPPAAFGDPRAFGDVADVTDTGAEIPLYFADRTFTTGPTETPANTPFKGILKNALNFETSLFDGGSLSARSGARAGRSVGEIVFNASDDLFAALEFYGWDGRQVALYQGERGAAFSTFTQRFAAPIDAVEWTDAEVTIRLRDTGALFDRPFQTNRYGGTGGSDGGADLAGKPRPFALGYVENITAPLVDATLLTYQLNDGPIVSVSDVRDKGASLTFAADYASYAALVAATIATGSYATCLAEGFIRLGASPDGEITADLRGLRTTSDPTKSYETLDTLIPWIASNRLGANNFAAAQVIKTSGEPTGIADFPAIGTCECGIFIGTERATVAQVLDDLLAPATGFYGQRLDGAFGWGFIAPGATGLGQTVVDSLTEKDIIGSPQRTDVRPVWAVNIGYERMFTVQSPSDLAASVSGADRSLYGNEFRYVVAQDTAVLAKHRYADLLTLNGPFRSSATFTGGFTGSVQNTILNRFKPQSGIFRVQVRRANPFAFNLNQQVNVSGVPGIYRGASTNMRIAKIELDLGTGALFLSLWG
jgi:hypothetical protein